MNRANFSRRAVIAALLGGSAAALAARYWVAEATADASLSLKLPQPEPGPAEAPSFAVFLALSQLVTLRQKLDEVVARRMYPLFLDEPWGPHHIRSTYDQLLGLLKQRAEQPKPDHPAVRGAMDKGQAWFAAHLLTTWYLGIYYHERMPPLRVAYAEALMFENVQPDIPRRFVEGTGFGEWGSPPRARSRP